MRSAIIVHGKPSKADYDDSRKPSPSNSLWLPWMQRQFLLRGIPAQTPEMLNAFQPDYRIWDDTFSQYRITPEVTLVGHSCGAGFLVQWLCQNPSIMAGHVFLVAPSFGDTLTPNDKYDLPLLGGFFDFALDPDLLGRIGSLHVIYSDDDNERVKATVELLTKVYPDINLHEFSGFGHFADYRTEQGHAYPEIMAIIDRTLGLVIH